MLIKIKKNKKNNQRINIKNQLKVSKNLAKIMINTINRKTKVKIKKIKTNISIVINTGLVANNVTI